MARASAPDTRWYRVRNVDISFTLLVQKFAHTFQKKDLLMSEITLHLPAEIKEEEARLFLMMKLFELGKLSLGKAAELSGYSKTLFMEILGKYGVPVMNYPAEDLEREMNL